MRLGGERTGRQIFLDATHETVTWALRRVRVGMGRVAPLAASRRGDAVRPEGRMAAGSAGGQPPPPQKKGILIGDIDVGIFSFKNSIKL